MSPAKLLPEEARMVRELIRKSDLRGLAWLRLEEKLTHAVKGKPTVSAAGIRKEAA